jgi:hypothetical protein
MAHAGPPNLAEGAARFAAAPVAVDPRLGRRSCPPEGFQFAWAGPQVEARCPATGERLLMPLAPEAEAPRLKRGEVVQAEYVGSGFRVSVGAVTESGAGNGRMTLRNSRSGQRFGARVDQSGRIIAAESDY